MDSYDLLKAKQDLETYSRSDLVKLGEFLKISKNGNFNDFLWGITLAIFSKNGKIEDLREYRYSAEMPLGTLVKIVKNRKYKGLQGIIKRDLGNFYDIELQIDGRIIRVAKGEVVELGTVDSGSRGIEDILSRMESIEVDPTTRLTQDLSRMW